MKINELLKEKKTTGIFAIIAFIGGFFFLNQTVTGNVIIESEKSINLISIIGLALIACAIILAFYSLKKK